MKLSLIIPAYKKEKVIGTQLTRIYNFLEKREPDFELLVVVDGHVDNTLEVVKDLVDSQGLNKIRIYDYKTNRGKGYAIRYGMKRAKGEIIGFTDADTDIKLKSLDVALEKMGDNDTKAVIPSKLHPKSKVNVPLYRKIFTLGLVLITKTVLDLPAGVNDVLCGLKLFRKEVVEEMLPMLKIDRFATDIEILYSLKVLGYRVAVVPFFAQIKSGSTITNIKQMMLILRDILIIYSKAWGRRVKYLYKAISKVKLLPSIK
ncbi:glycosyltransferase [Candidatus Dojkabacteria bacterium]|nr:glycosyltransferase [Candidatus Dojkabacteria bacterium]